MFAKILIQFFILSKDFLYFTDSLETVSYFLKNQNHFQKIPFIKSIEIVFLTLT